MVRLADAVGPFCYQVPYAGGAPINMQPPGSPPIWRLAFGRARGGSDCGGGRQILADLRDAPRDSGHAARPVAYSTRFQTRFERLRSYFVQAGAAQMPLRGGRVEPRGSDASRSSAGRECDVPWDQLVSLSCREVAARRRRMQASGHALAWGASKRSRESRRSWSGAGLEAWHVKKSGDGLGDC